MQNGETDPEVLLQQVRAEVRRRKLALEVSAVGHREAASDSVPETISAPAPPQIRSGQPEQRGYLAGALLALERARSKQKKARRWLPIIRRIRRNQGAINDSLIDAVQGHHDTMQILRGAFLGIDQRLAKLRDFIRTQERQTAEEQRQLEDLHQQFSEIWASVRKQQQDSIRIESRLSEYQEPQKHDLIEIQAFIAAQQKQTSEERHQLDEQQRQIFDLTSKLIAYQEEAGTRALRTTKQQQQHERRLSEIRALIVAQQEQTKEVHRQFEQQQQETASIESRLTERQEQQKQELTEIRDSIQAQQKQTAGEQRQFEESWKKLDEIRASLQDQQKDAVRIESRLNQHQEQQGRELTEIRDFIQAQVKQNAEEQRELQDSHEQLSEIRASIVPNATLLRERMNALQSSFDLLLDHFAKRKRPLPEPAARLLSEELQHQATDDFYVAFENQFRGSPEMIKERLTFYLPIVQETKDRTGDGTALDLGCGRGEWLELLKENGFDARGVDLNSGMVEACRSRGLEVECADANTYLAALPSASLSLITGFHIVEHLPFVALLDLFRQSFRVLRAEGRAIFETPNPECLQVTNYSFFLDPTHRNPIPQELLSFIARYAGFGAVRVERLHPYFEEEVLKGYGDYAGILTK